VRSSTLCEVLSPVDSRSFLFRKSTSLYNRRQAKIVSTLTSLFTSSYVFHWQLYFPDTPLRYPPSFDGRIVLYPSAREVRDYFSWRQADSEYHYSHFVTHLLAEILQCSSAHQQPIQYSVLGSCTARWRDYNTGTRDFAGPLSWSVSASPVMLAIILQRLPSHSGSNTNLPLFRGPTLPRSMRSCFPVSTSTTTRSRRDIGRGAYSSGNRCVCFCPKRRMFMHDCIRNCLRKSH
jgi:tRNAHis guanylyltransferase